MARARRWRSTSTTRTGDEAGAVSPRRRSRRGREIVPRGARRSLAAAHRGRRSRRGAWTSPGSGHLQPGRRARLRSRQRGWLRGPGARHLRRQRVRAEEAAAARRAGRDGGRTERRRRTGQRDGDPYRRRHSRGADAGRVGEHTPVRLDGAARGGTGARAPVPSIPFAGIGVAQGETVLRAHDVLTSRETGVLAAMGIARVSVVAQPRVAILSTGDEIIAPGAPLPVGKVYDSNATILGDAVCEQGGTVVPLGVVGDDFEAVTAALAHGLAAADVVLLSGGTSKGPGDLNVRAVEAVLGPSSIVVHGVALKPGKPICLAVSGAKPVVVLPGFPASTIFTFHEFVAPVIRKLAGRDEQDVARVAARVPHGIRQIRRAHDGNPSHG